MITTNLILGLLFILVTAWALGSLFVPMGRPFILGGPAAGLRRCAHRWVRHERERGGEMVVAPLALKLSNDLLAAGTIGEPLLTNQQFPALILMAFVTATIAPMILRWSVMRSCRKDEKATFCVLRDDRR